MVGCFLKYFYTKEVQNRKTVQNRGSAATIFQFLRDGGGGCATVPALKSATKGRFAPNINGQPRFFLENRDRKKSRTKQFLNIKSLYLQTQVIPEFAILRGFYRY